MPHGGFNSLLEQILGTALSDTINLLYLTPRHTQTQSTGHVLFVARQSLGWFQTLKVGQTWSLIYIINPLFPMPQFLLLFSVHTA